MKIAIIGFGKMGKMVKSVAEQMDHQVIATVSREIKPELVRGADVCIEFSHPDAVLKNIEILADLKKPIVVGTTGWYDKLDEVKEIVGKNQIGLIYSPNFSIGVHLFHKMVAHAAQIMQQFDLYDVGGIEMHHNQKADSPSGTALTLAQTILDHFPRKTKIVTELSDKPKKEELHFASLRCGSIPGTHTVHFDSPVDSISLTHTARNREGFSRGAIMAGEWIINKQGLYTLNDMIN
jgi:4-hydroxy-tetrahydrodipicolinate reductase